MSEQTTQYTIDPGLVGMWSRRVEIPHDIWKRTIQDANREVSLMATALGGFSKDAAMLQVAREKLEAGCRFRIVLQSPNCDAAYIMAMQKHDPIDDKIYASLERFNAFRNSLSETARKNFQMRYYSSWMGSSIFRGDDVMLVTPFIPWVIVDTSTTYMIRRVADSSLFDSYLQGFEGIWKHSEPI